MNTFVKVSVMPGPGICFGWSRRRNINLKKKINDLRAQLTLYQEVIWRPSGCAIFWRLKIITLTIMLQPHYRPEQIALSKTILITGRRMTAAHAGSGRSGLIGDN